LNSRATAHGKIKLFRKGRKKGIILATEEKRNTEDFDGITY